MVTLALAVTHLQMGETTKKRELPNQGYSPVG